MCLTSSPFPGWVFAGQFWHRRSRSPTLRDPPSFVSAHKVSLFQARHDVLRFTCSGRQRAFHFSSYPLSTTGTVSKSLQVGPSYGCGKVSLSTVRSCHVRHSGYALKLGTQYMYHLPLVKHLGCVGRFLAVRIGNFGHFCGKLVFARTPTTLSEAVSQASEGGFFPVTVHTGMVRYQFHHDVHLMFPISSLRSGISLGDWGWQFGNCSSAVRLPVKAAHCYGDPHLVFSWSTSFAFQPVHRPDYRDAQLPFLRVRVLLVEFLYYRSTLRYSKPGSLISLAWQFGLVRVFSVTFCSLSVFLVPVCLPRLFPHRPLCVRLLCDGSFLVRLILDAFRWPKTSRLLLPQVAVGMVLTVVSHWMCSSVPESLGVRLQLFVLDGFVFGCVAFVCTSWSLVSSSPASS